MDVESINWLTTLVFGIIGGGLIGWVFGHKMKEGAYNKLLTTPMALQQGPTGTILVLVGLGLIVLSFTIGIWQGVVAIILGYVTNTIVGGRVMNDENGGLSKAIKTTLLLLTVVCLPFGVFQYYQYNRAPNEQERLTFIYECDEYMTNDVYEGKYRDTAKAVCSCLWPGLSGRYKTIGAINEKVRSDGKISIGDKDVNTMASICLKDYQNRD